MAVRRRVLTSICFIVLITLTSAAPFDTNDYTEKMSCEVDGDCPKGQFCYKDFYSCATCISCASRFRQNGTMGCHQEAADCGDCLPGYEEVRLERGKQKESCKPITSAATTSVTATKQSRNDPTENMRDTPWLFAVATLSCLIIVTAFLIKQWNRRRDTVVPQPPGTELQELVNCSANPPPPPYSPFSSECLSSINTAPTAPTLESSTFQIDSPKDCGTNICMQTQSRFWPTEQERLVQAKLFHPPNWVNTSKSGFGSSQPNQSGDESEDEFDGQHDENTQPSSWTPIAEDSLDSAAPLAQTSTSSQFPQNVAGSTAVGTVNLALSRTSEEAQMTCFGRRFEVDEGHPTDRENCNFEDPQTKRLRSESPDPSTERPRDSSRVFFSQNNLNRNTLHLQQLQAPSISINFNLGRRDLVLSDSDESPTTTALPNSEDLFYDVSRSGGH